MSSKIKIDLSIEKVGESMISSPLKEKNKAVQFVTDDRKVLFEIFTEDSNKYSQGVPEQPTTEVAGPREKIYFDPATSKAAIVTCGGLCPGINDVIRAIFISLFYEYGVKEIYGIANGYAGFIEEYGHEMIQLTPEVVDDIHEKGGSILGSSRGKQDSTAMVDFLIKKKINLLFVIGGDGTMRGALAIAEETKLRNAEISVIGIPKTIDNDILHLDRTFGIITAAQEAMKAIQSVHTEARSYTDTIGIVQLMGRHSGFIAASASVAQPDANFVLIPESPFKLIGKNGLLNCLKRRMETKKHAVIVVAEGAGQEFFKDMPKEKDASGNVLNKDIALFLSDQIKAFFKKAGKDINIKYVNPSYMVRSVPASAMDRVYCTRLGQSAVHAAMSGRTKMIVGARHAKYVHLPMAMITKGRRYVNLQGDLWSTVLGLTGQPFKIG
ncbi:MAG: ATP-dependent 6-phosphofructokinase [Flavobacteriaceae bacterium]